MAKKRVHRPEGSRPIPPPAPKEATGQPRAAAVAKQGVRERFEDFSTPILRGMQAVPSFLIPVTLGILLFFGLALSASWSGILLILIAVFLFWMTAVSWPAITTGSRILRLAVDVAVLVLGVMKVTGRL